MIICRENYDGIITNWHPSGPFPSSPPRIIDGAQMDWNHWQVWGTDIHGVTREHNGIGHWSGEIISPGRNGKGKALHQWVFNGLGANDYAGYLWPLDLWKADPVREYYARMFWFWPSQIYKDQVKFVGRTRIFNPGSSTVGQLTPCIYNVGGGSAGWIKFVVGSLDVRLPSPNDMYLSMGMGSAKPGQWNMVELHYRQNTVVEHITGTHSGSDSNITLIDSNPLLNPDMVKHGMAVINKTDCSVGYVNGVPEVGKVNLSAPLWRGSDNKFQSGDEYVVVNGDGVFEMWINGELRPTQYATYPNRSLPGGYPYLPGHPDGGALDPFHPGFGNPTFAPFEVDNESGWAAVIWDDYVVSTEPIGAPRTITIEPDIKIASDGDIFRYAPGPVEIEAE